MNKIKNLVWILSIAILCALAFILYNKTSTQTVKTDTTPVFSDEFVETNQDFSDGLNNPDSVTTYPLDEYGMGVAEKTVYYIDINNDKNADRITKTLIETGNAHSYYEYKVELNKNGKFVDVTPNNFKTTNGENCDLQQIQFVFKPQFKVVLISRELGETWNTPTLAKKEVFKLSDDKFNIVDTKTLRKVCDVKELFY